MCSHRFCVALFISLKNPLNTFHFEFSCNIKSFYYVFFYYYYSEKLFKKYFLRFSQQDSLFCFRNRAQTGIHHSFLIFFNNYFHYYCKFSLYTKKLEYQAGHHFFCLFVWYKGQTHCFLPENAYKPSTQSLRLIWYYTEARADTERVSCKQTSSGQFPEVKQYLWSSLNGQELMMFYKSWDFWGISNLKRVCHVIISKKGKQYDLSNCEPCTLNNNPGKMPGKAKGQNKQVIKECQWNVHDYASIY